MREWRNTGIARAVFDLKYHVIRCTKYRYKILRGRVTERARDLIRQICQARDVVIVRGAVSADHIQLLLSPRQFCHRRRWCSTARDAPVGICRGPELRKRYGG